MEIEHKNLNIAFPSSQIKIVAIQSYLYLTNGEPYQWPDDKKAEQKNAIKRTLAIAAEGEAHFTLFPEYSIPGLEGIDLVEDWSAPQKLYQLKREYNRLIWYTILTKERRLYS